MTRRVLDNPQSLIFPAQTYDRCGDSTRSPGLLPASGDGGVAIRFP